MGSLAQKFHIAQGRARIPSVPMAVRKAVSSVHRLGGEAGRPQTARDTSLCHPFSAERTRVDSECPTLTTQVESPSVRHPWTDVLTPQKKRLLKGRADLLLLTPETGMLLAGSSPGKGGTPSHQNCI